MPEPAPMTVTDLRGLAQRLRGEIAKAVVGQTQTVDLMLTALLAGGHILLEGPPGTAKTFLAQCFARTLGLDYGTSSSRRTSCPAIFSGPISSISRPAPSP